MDPVIFTYHGVTYNATVVERERRLPEYRKPFEGYEDFNDIRVTTENDVIVSFVDNGFREKPTNDFQVDDSYSESENEADDAEDEGTNDESNEAYGRWCDEHGIRPYLACPYSVDRLFLDPETGYLMAECQTWCDDMGWSGFDPDGISYIRFEQGRWFFNNSLPEVSYARPV